MRSTYWSCTSFADWIRGTDKPDAATGPEWNRWRRQAKLNSKIRYWIAEEGLDALQNFVYKPVDILESIRYYVNNRWVSRSHALTAHPGDIKPGTWSDVGNRFLPCLFNELVDFVEIESAWHHCVWDEKTRDKYQPPWWRRGWLRWRMWRCPEAGIEQLEWAASLTMGASLGLSPTDKRFNQPTAQAKAAQEILELYYWWKEERPHRGDPMELSGWSAYCDERRARNDDHIFDDGNETPAQKAQGRRALLLSNKIEQAHEREDERMMIRLIKVRQSLWT